MFQDLIDKIVSVVNQETLGMLCHGETSRASMKNYSRFVDPNLLF